MAEKLSTGFVDAIQETGSVKSVMADFIIRLFNGAQPADADDAEGSVDMLCEITLDAGAFTSGVSTNGLNFGDSADGVLAKAVAENWKGLGTATCGAVGKTATWFRAYANTVVTGASTMAVRYDGSVGPSAAYELQLSNVVIVENKPVVIDTFTYKTPRA